MEGKIGAEGVEAMLEILEMMAGIILIALIVLVWLASPFAIIFGFLMGWKFSGWIADKLER